jgi:hypothetical protein
MQIKLITLRNVIVLNPVEELLDLTPRFARSATDVDNCRRYGGINETWMV